MLIQTQDLLLLKPLCRHFENCRLLSLPANAFAGVPALQTLFEFHAYTLIIPYILLIITIITPFRDLKGAELTVYPLEALSSLTELQSL